MRSFVSVAALGLVLTTSGLASAQSAGGAPMQSRPPAAQKGPTPAQMAKFQEFQAVKEKLDGIRERAMKSEKLKKKEKALRDRIDAAMVEADPKADKKLARFEKLQKEFEAARAKQDVTAAQRIAGEIQPLMQSLSATREKVMADAKISGALDDFRDAVMAKMTKLDPETPKLIAQAERLSKELQASMRGPG